MNVRSQIHKRERLLDQLSIALSITPCGICERCAKNESQGNVITRYNCTHHFLRIEINYPACRRFGRTPASTGTPLPCKHIFQVVFLQKLFSRRQALSISWLECSLFCPEDLTVKLHRFDIGFGVIIVYLVTSCRVFGSVLGVLASCVAFSTCDRFAHLLRRIDPV